MTRIKTLINDVSALAIAREMKELNESCEATRKKLMAEAQTKFNDHVELVNKKIGEDFERIRLAMGLPSLINPMIEDVHSDLGIIIIHHGAE